MIAALWSCDCDVMKRLKIARISEWLARYCQSGIPCTWSKDGRPVRTQSRQDPHADHIGCDISNSALSRSEPCTSLRNVSPSGVSPKQPAASRVNTPMLARWHKMRLSDGAWQPA